MKLQMKLTKAALERLLTEDVEIETIIGHQAIETIIEYHSNRIKSRIHDRIKEGLDLDGNSVAFVELNRRIKDIITVEVGNYVRNNESVLRAMIVAETTKQVEEQLPSKIKQAVTNAMNRVTEALGKQL